MSISPTQYFNALALASVTNLPILGNILKRRWLQDFDSSRLEMLTTLRNASTPKTESPDLDKSDFAKKFRKLEKVHTLDTFEPARIIRIIYFLAIPIIIGFAIGVVPGIIFGLIFGIALADTASESNSISETLSQSFWFPSASAAEWKAVRWDGHVLLEQTTPHWPVGWLDNTSK